MLVAFLSGSFWVMCWWGSGPFEDAYRTMAWMCMWLCCGAVVSGVGGLCSSSGVCISPCGSYVVVASSFSSSSLKPSFADTGSLSESAAPCPPPASELPSFTEFPPLPCGVLAFECGAFSISIAVVYSGCLFILIFTSSGQCSFDSRRLCASGVGVVFCVLLISSVFACIYLRCV